MPSEKKFGGGRREAFPLAADPDLGLRSKSWLERRDFAGLLRSKETGETRWAVWF